MNLGLSALFDRAERASEPLILATVTATEGPTYRKAGAMALIDAQGNATGLISGGCLEADLAQRASTVFVDDLARMTSYDLRADNPVWGLGLGCRGRLDILLESAHRENLFAGLLALRPYQDEGKPCWLHKSLPTGPTPSQWQIGDAPIAGFDGLVVEVLPPPRLLVCGAGSDALPLVQLAAATGWRVTVTDHRDAFARPAHFPGAHLVRCGAPETAGELAGEAVVVMSHHIEHDAAYLRAVAAAGPRYLGLLGPASRRDEVLRNAQLPATTRVHGPAGLDIGADLPETIALSILAEAQAVVAGRSARPLFSINKS